MKAWEPVKARIYELYICKGLSLVQVREALAREEGFEACTRSYRAQISKWGWLKNNHHHNNPVRGHSVETSTFPANSKTAIKRQASYSQISGEPQQQLGRKSDNRLSAQPENDNMPHFPTLSRSASFCENSDGGIMIPSPAGIHTRHYPAPATAPASHPPQKNAQHSLQQQHRSISHNFGQKTYLNAISSLSSPIRPSSSPSSDHARNGSSGSSSNTGSVSPMSSPDDRPGYSAKSQHQQRQQTQRENLPGEMSKSVVVILDNHGLNRLRSGSCGGSGVVPSSGFPLKQDMFTRKDNIKLENSVIDEDDETVEVVEDDEELEDAEERRRYGKRQRHRSIIDVGVHEIRFGSSSASTSASNSPRTIGDDEETYVGVDSGMVSADDDDDGNDEDGPKEMEIEQDIVVKTEDEGRMLEEVNPYTAHTRNSAFRNIYAAKSPRLSSNDSYSHVLNHKSPTPVSNSLSTRIVPPSPLLAAMDDNSRVSRVASPFQRISSPFIRAAGTVSATPSAFLEIRESCPQSGGQPNLNQFAKISDWLLVLINGVSRGLPMQVTRLPPSSSRFRNLSILYHPQPPPGGNGMVHLGTIPTIHAQDPTGKSPLHIAIKHRLPLEIIKLLLDLGGNVASKDDQDVNCLHEALKLTPPPVTNTSPTISRAEWTRSYLLPLVQLLLTTSDVETGDIDVDSNSNCRARVAHILVNEPMSWSSESPIHVALKHHQDLSVIKLLIDFGAIVSGVKDVFGSTPLHIVCQSCMSSLTPANTSNSTLTDIPRKSAIVDLLLDNGAGADTNLKTADGHTPLHYAVRMLYSSLPTPPGSTPSQKQAMSWSPTSDSVDIVELLITKGHADVSIRNGEGFGAIQMASLALAGRVEIDCDDHSNGNIMTQLVLLGKAVRMLVKAERERFLKREDEKKYGELSSRS